MDSPRALATRFEAYADWRRRLAARLSALRERLAEDDLANAQVFKCSRRYNGEVAAVKGVRGITKRDMIHNDYLPRMEVDPQTYAVRADGQLLTCEAAVSLPMTQRYFLF